MNSNTQERKAGRKESGLISFNFFSKLENELRTQLN